MWWTYCLQRCKCVPALRGTDKHVSELSSSFRLPPGEGSWTWWWWLTYGTGLVKWNWFLLSSITNLSRELYVEAAVRPRFNLLQHPFPLLLRVTQGLMWSTVLNTHLYILSHSYYEWKLCVPIKNVTLASVGRGAVEVAAFSPGVGLQERIKTEPVFFHFSQCWQRSRENMVAVWICCVQLENWDQRNHKLKSKGSLSLLVLPSNWSADFMGGDFISVTGHRGDTSLNLF